MGSDDGIRASVAKLPEVALGPVHAVVAPPLERCRVAIVTTAGLRPASDPGLAPVDDASFRELPAGARDLQLAHFSPNFDRTGLVADLDVVYPADRLAELAAAGEIGSVASRHLSFMGAQFDLATLLADTAHRAAAVLLADDVDVAVLTPV